MSYSSLTRSHSTTRHVQSLLLTRLVPHTHLSTFNQRTPLQTPGHLVAASQVSQQTCLFVLAAFLLALLARVPLSPALNIPTLTHTPPHPALPSYLYASLSAEKSRRTRVGDRHAPMVGCGNLR